MFVCSFFVCLFVCFAALKEKSTPIYGVSCMFTLSISFFAEVQVEQQTVPSKVRIVAEDVFISCLNSKLSRRLAASPHLKSRFTR